MSTPRLNMGNNGGGRSAPLPPPPPSNSRPQPARPGNSSPFGQSLGSRFGQRVNWEVMPFHDTMVRFDLTMGDTVMEATSFVRCIPNDDTAPGELIARTLEGDKALMEIVKGKLEAAWQGYQLRGALLVYPWRDELRQAMNVRLETIKTPSVYLNATNPLLVLNVLARAERRCCWRMRRSRSNVLSLRVLLPVTIRVLWRWCARRVSPSFRFTNPNPCPKKRPAAMMMISSEGWSTTPG
ncbi:MAG: hypothetical protein HC828_17370 [Blastochloris sp.]|nr:hypothetical protein [Blastochloris sp.]